MTKLDSDAELSRMLDKLTRDERDAVEGHYRWYSIGDTVSKLGASAKSEAKRYRRSRAFKTGIRELERLYRLNGR
jgi:hypothetical protein